MLFFTAVYLSDLKRALNMDQHVEINIGSSEDNDKLRESGFKQLLISFLVILT